MKPSENDLRPRSICAWSLTLAAFLLGVIMGDDGVLHADSNQKVSLPANDHGFDVNWGGFGTQIARAKIKDFLERYTAAQQADSASN